MRFLRPALMISFALLISGCGNDLDGDGFDSTAAKGADCDDSDSSINPDATEIYYDGVDQNCDGLSDFDADLDGFDSDEHDGEDCDDEDENVNPDAVEVYYNGTDQDCDGASDYDADGDGEDSAAELPTGSDCDDADATVNSTATEVYYDGVDQDCDGASDYDADGDGEDSDAHGGVDCDDTDATINSAATEIYYDGVDQDCDGASDNDADLDGYDSDAHGGADCDDDDDEINPDAVETYYDGVDQDCDGASDYDQDGDGEDAELFSGDDCDDDDADINSSAEEYCDGIDSDCDGVDDPDNRVTLIDSDQITMTNYTTIQEAIDATDGTQNDAVSVCPGTYTETVVITSDVLMVGSLSGTSTIDADGIKGAAITVENGANAAINYFTLTNGSGTNGSATFEWLDGLSTGGCLSAIDGGELVVDFVSFSDCFGDYGGAISASATKDSYILNSAFSHVDAVALGGAIFAYADDTVTTPALIVRDSTFTNGTAESGGFISAYLVDTELTNSTFSNGEASNAGGVFVSDSSDVEITGCTFQANTADVGGAAYIYNGDTTIEDSSFTESDASYGGALIVVEADISFIDTDISDNIATYSGGAAYLSYATVYGLEATDNIAMYGGGVLFDASHLYNGTVEDNTGDFGGGVYIYLPGNRGVLLEEVSIENNIANEFGGGLYLGTNAALTMNNGTVRSNTDEDGGAAYIEEYSDYPGRITLLSNDVDWGRNNSDNLDNDVYFSGGGIYDYDGNSTFECRAYYGTCGALTGWDGAHGWNDLDTSDTGFQPTLDSGMYEWQDTAAGVTWSAPRDTGPDTDGLPNSYTIFFDDFELGKPDPQVWEAVGDIDGSPRVTYDYAHSLWYSMGMGGRSTFALTDTFDATGCDGVRWSYMGKRGPEAPNSSDELQVYVQQGGDDYEMIGTWPGNGMVDNGFTLQQGNIPRYWLDFDDLQIWLINYSDEQGGDDYYIDDFEVRCIVGDLDTAAPSWNFDSGDTDTDTDGWDTDTDDTGDTDFQWLYDTSDTGACPDASADGTNWYAQIPDCKGDCYLSTWVGDSDCDDGAVYFYGDPDFNCAAFSYDMGDCGVDTGGMVDTGDIDDTSDKIGGVDTSLSGSLDTGDSGFVMPEDTAIIVLGWRGEAVVSPGSSYVGTETFWVQDWKTINDTASDEDICGWAWDMADNGTSPSISCTDPDGNSCDFEFYVEGTNGAEVVGTDCSVHAPALSVTQDAYGYGYIDDYQYLGSSYGTRLFFYDSTNQQWVPSGIIGSYLYQASSWDSSSGDFEYSYWQGAYYTDAALLP